MTEITAAADVLPRLTDYETERATFRIGVPGRLIAVIEIVERCANYIEGGPWTAFAVRDARLIADQQQYSGRKVAALVIEALGV